MVLAEHELLTGDVVLRELDRILTRKIRLSTESAKQTIAFLRQYTVEPQPAAPADLPASDPDDAWVLASAMAAGADVLITGDPHLLELARRVNAPVILKPREFWELHRGSSS